jgi:hypothetical protein
MSRFQQSPTAKKCQKISKKKKKKEDQWYNTVVYPKQRHVRRNNNLNFESSIHPSRDPSLGEILAIQSD